MRYDVKKYLIVGAQEDRDRFFRKAQKIGMIHFIDISPQKSKEVSPEIQNMLLAIKILRGLPTIEQQEMDDYSRGDEIARKIINLKDEIEKNQEEVRILNLEISRIDIFGYFNLDDIAYIEKEGHCKIQYFCAKQNVMEEKDIQDTLIYVGSDHELDYFIAINKEPKSYESMIEMHIDRSLGDLKRTLQQDENNIHRFETELKSLAKYNTYLHHALIYKLNTENLLTNQQFSQPVLDGALFAVEGWVPEHKIEDLISIVNDLPVHYEEIAIEPWDHIPTYLENKGAAKVGEDLVDIFDTPSHKDKDPSLWVLFAFSLFFAMIIGDAGYGLIFLVTALFLAYRFPSVSGIKKRMLYLFTLLSVACIIWGTLTSSFFGIELSPDNPFRKISLMQWLVEKQIAYHMQHQDEVFKGLVEKFPQTQGITNSHLFLEAIEQSHTKESRAFYEASVRKTMFELAIFVGIVHISLSFIRNLNRNLAGIGWIILIIGAYLYIPYYLKGTSLVQYAFGFKDNIGGVIGLQLIIFGFVLALVISIWREKWLGLVEVMVPVQIFADVLSYLRIYALAVAGATVSAVVNEIAGPLPFVFAAILLILAHAINMLLGIMGGIIHGLRLNFLEWYRYSFEGKGKPFNPLRILEIEH